MIDSTHINFLESGIIEEYHLGIASGEEVTKLLALCQKYPEAQKMSDEGSASLLYLLKSYEKNVPTRTRAFILNGIASKRELEKAALVGSEAMLDIFVPISSYSSVEKWNKLLEDVHPDDEFENIFAKPLFQSDQHELTLVWAKEIVPDEIHTDQSESFFLLEGTANCHIGDEVYAMQKGDYMLIPMHVNHKVVVTSLTPAKAIMSRVAI